MAENCAYEGGSVDSVGVWPGIGSEVVPRGFGRGTELVCVGSKGRSDPVVGASRLEPRETSENEVTGETVGDEHTDHTETTEHTELHGQSTFRDGTTAEETTPRAVTQKPEPQGEREGTSTTSPQATPGEAEMEQGTTNEEVSARGRGATAETPPRRDPAS